MFLRHEGFLGALGAFLRSHELGATEPLPRPHTLPPAARPAPPALDTVAALESGWSANDVDAYAGAIGGVRTHHYPLAITIMYTETAHSIMYTHVVNNCSTLYSLACCYIKTAQHCIHRSAYCFLVDTFLYGKVIVSRGATMLCCCLQVLERELRLQVSKEWSASFSRRFAVDVGALGQPPADTQP